MMSWKFGHMWLKIIKQAPLSLKSRQPPTSETPHDISDLANMAESQQRAWRWHCFRSSANLIENEQGPMCLKKLPTASTPEMHPWSFKISQHLEAANKVPGDDRWRFESWANLIDDPRTQKKFGGRQLAGSQIANICIWWHSEGFEILPPPTLKMCVPMKCHEVRDGEKFRFQIGLYSND